MQSKRGNSIQSRCRWEPALLVALAVSLASLVARPSSAIEGPGNFEPVNDPSWMFSDPEPSRTRRILTTDVPAAIPRSPAGDILQSWIGAHNSASVEALRFWLRASLNPSISDDEVDKRLGGYVDATNTFGPLSEIPLAVLENTPHRLLVHLVRRDLAVSKRLNPMNIVVVEVDLDADNPRYLRRCLSLVSLATEPRKPAAD